MRQAQLFATPLLINHTHLISRLAKKVVVAAKGGPNPWQINSRLLSKYTPRISHVLNASQGITSYPSKEIDMEVSN